MNSNPASASRRDFLKTTGQAAAVAALAGSVVPKVHAAGSDLVQVALIGCGGRGTGAAGDALDTSKQGPIKLTAMADAYADRLRGSYNNLSRRKEVDVPEDRRFVGFDAYKRAMDTLKKGDVVIMATPLAFRGPHFAYAISKGLNVFMEKPITADGPTSKRMLKLAEESEAKNLKVGVGLMSRHARNLQELHKRIQDGEIGEIIAMRGYRMAGLIGHFASTPKPKDMSELDYQVRRFHSLLWAGGGAFSDFNIHIIDHLCWMKNAWPVRCQALGGRHYQKNKDGEPYVDQNLDTYACEYTFEDGTKLFFDGRCMAGAKGIYSSYVHGSKGIAVASREGDCGGPSATHKGQNPSRANELWRSEEDPKSPYKNEWDALIAAIRADKPHNEARRGIEASVVTSMGRMAAHTGQEITYDAMLNCPHEFAPGVENMTKDSPAPVQPDANGIYPQPQPGIKKDREY